MAFSLYLRLRCWWGGRAAVAAPRARPEGARRPGGAADRGRSHPHIPGHPHGSGHPFRPGHPHGSGHPTVSATPTAPATPHTPAVFSWPAPWCRGDRCRRGGREGTGAYVLRGRSVQRVTVPLATSACGPRVQDRASAVHPHRSGARPGFAERVVGTINATRSLDLIAVVGDSGRRERGEPRPAVAPLARLRARGTARSSSPAATMYLSGAEPWVERRARDRPAACRCWRTRGSRDGRLRPGRGQCDVTRTTATVPITPGTLGDRDRSRAAVLLAHQPVMIHEAVKRGVDLQLSGHTHGGQLWPGSFIADAANPTRGPGALRRHAVVREPGRGGAWAPPVRGAPSDITVVELASKQA